MNFKEMEEVVDDAERTLRFANIAIKQVAHLSVGRLKSSGVSHRVLEDLKKELRNYNIQTGRWKDI